MRAATFLDSLVQDIRYAVRILLRAPGFATIAILTLALGIGATTAIFSVVNAVLLRPLPFKDSDGLVRLYENIPATGAPDSQPRRLPGMDVRELLELRARARTLSHVVSNGFSMVTAACGDEAVRLFGAPLSGSVLQMLGVPPARGRWFLPAEEIAGADREVILSDTAWQRCFQRDPTVLGKTLTFTGRAPGGLGGNVPLGVPFTIVGVMPSSFHFPGAGIEFWTPMPLTAPADGRPRRTTMMARLADGASIDAAAAELATIVHDVRGGPAFDPRRFELVRMRDEMTARVRPALLMLTAAVGVLLLIACANVANLLLGRAAARRRELAIRVAIGAGRMRLVRQTLTESVLLAAIGGAIGIGFAFTGVRLFRTLATNLPRVDLRTGAAFPRLDEVAVDQPLLLFVIVVSVATGLLFGLVPALRTSQTDATRDLRDTAASGGRLRLPRMSAQGALVVGQVAMAILLFVGGALLLRSFVGLTRVAPGYEAAGVVTFQIASPGERGSVEQLRAFSEQVVDRIVALPGVTSAGYANQLPMVGLRDTAGGVWRTPDPTRSPPSDGPDARFVSRGFLTTMGVRVVAGRSFTDEDGPGAPRVMLVNQALAAREFQGENPVGQRVYIFRSPEPWEIVGVVADVRQFGLDRDPEPQFFVDVRQFPPAGPPLFPGGAYYAVRTSADTAAVVTSIRAVLRDIEPRASLDNIATMTSIVSNSVAEPRLYAVIVATFAAVAVTLAVVGIAGVVAYAVSRRTHEIGIRMALGAARADVLSLVLRESSALTAIGIAAGLLAAAGVTRYLSSLLFGVTPLDTATFVGAAVAFAGVSLAASFVPARRATKVDPLIALRQD